MKEIAAVLFAILAVIIYCLPTIQARNHKKFRYIWTINLLLGWTILGWVISHIWANTQDNNKSDSQK